MEQQTTTNDIFARAAAAGPVAGAYFFVLFICAAYSGSYSLLAIPALGMMLAVPWLLYRRMVVRMPRQHRGRVIILWTEGIYTFLFGGLLMALMIYLWLRFADPGYMTRQLQLAAELMQSNPGAVSPELRRAVDDALHHGAMPGAIQMAMSVFWIVTFSGALLSLLVALITCKIKSSR